MAAPLTYRTAAGATVTPAPRTCGRCGGPVDAAGACRRRCDLDARVVRQDDEHPAGGGAE